MGRRAFSPKPQIYVSPHLLPGLGIPFRGHRVEVELSLSCDLSFWEINRVKECSADYGIEIWSLRHFSWELEVASRNLIHPNPNPGELVQNRELAKNPSKTHKHWFPTSNEKGKQKLWCMTYISESFVDSKTKQLQVFQNLDSRF